MGPKFTITKEYTFDSAHWLPKVPEGHKCKNVHGHTYTAKFACKTWQLDEQGFVTDYAKIDEVVKPWIKALDHVQLNDLKGLENPTAETIAKFLYLAVKKALPFLVWVEVCETPKTSARYGE